MIVDSHLHIWERSAGQYGWLVPEFGPIYDDFPPERASRELVEAGVSGAILVQADDTEFDARYMFDAAKRYPWVWGVVAWVPIDEPAKAEAILGQWLSEETFCGVRQLVHDDPRDNVYRLPEVATTVDLLAHHGLPLDVPDAWPRDLPQVVDLARTHPGLTVILDHMGKPPVDPDELVRWSSSIRAFAEQPNTVVKLSGLHRPDRPFTLDSVKSLWDLALDFFGPERMMVGSDWPISVAYGGYQPTWQTMQSLVATLSDGERDAVSWRTATRVYGRSQRLIPDNRQGGH